MDKKLYRVGFVGDIHGEAASLEKIIAKMEAHGVDRIISLGDLFDRGPDAPRALRIVMNRGFKKMDGTRGDIEMILGNHEDRNLRCWMGLPIPGRKGKVEPWTPKEFNKIEEHEWRWLASLPFMIRIQEHGLDLVAVHGGFTADMQSPGWYNFDRGGQLARVGYLNEKTGESLGPSSYSKRFWADEYDGRFGRAVFGHTTFSKVRYSPNAVGIDGSKFGRIFGIVISNQEADKLFEVKAFEYIPTPKVEAKAESKKKTYKFNGKTYESWWNRTLASENSSSIADDFKYVKDEDFQYTPDPEQDSEWNPTQWELFR